MRSSSSESMSHVHAQDELPTSDAKSFLSSIQRRGCVTCDAMKSIENHQRIFILSQFQDKLGGPICTEKGICCYICDPTHRKTKLCVMKAHSPTSMCQHKISFTWRITRILTNQVKQQPPYSFRQTYLSMQPHKDKFTHGQNPEAQQSHKIKSFIYFYFKCKYVQRSLVWTNGIFWN